MKIAISGAGIAGPALAYWLERIGHEPVLIEKAPRLRTGGYVIDFWGLGYTIAERMGILPQVRAAGYSVKEVRLVNARGRKVGGFSVRVFDRTTKGRFTSLPRGQLAEVIYREIENRVESIFDNSIAAIEEHESGVRVSFDHGPPREFDLVIGADGLHSKVRELAFGPESQFEKRLGYRVAAFEVDGYQPRDELVYLAYTLPGRQIARFALRGGRTIFFFMFGADGDSSEPRDNEERKAVLHRVFANDGWECPQILQAMDAADEVYLDGVTQIRMKQKWSKGRVALIGDAAACVSLLAGEGTGLAMTEAYVMAGELKRAGDDYSAAFRRYEEQLRLLIEVKQRSAVRFAGAFAPKTRLGLWFRNQMTKLLSIRLVADWLVGRELKDEFELPDYGM